MRTFASGFPPDAPDADVGRSAGDISGQMKLSELCASELLRKAGVFAGDGGGVV